MSRVRSTSPVTVEEIPLGHPRLRLFVSFPWELYRGDACWVPPLTAQLLGHPLLGIAGLLTPRHPYHREAEVTHFLAWRGDRPVGRISAAINHRFNKFHGSRFGFFGFFDVVKDYEVARLLLDRAREWLLKHGATVMRGPGEYSCATHERQGVLVDGFGMPNCFDTTYNYPYYGEFLEQYGFFKAKDYHGYCMNLSSERLANEQLPWAHRYVGRIKARSGFSTRSVTPESLRHDVGLIMEIYNDAWAQNWGFLPLSQFEVDAIASFLKLFYEPDLVRLAFIDGQPVAMLGMIPDPNWCFRPLWKWYGDADLLRILRLIVGRKRIQRLRWFFFGVKQRFRNLGADMLLSCEALEHYLARGGYNFMEASLVLEDNWQTIKALETIGMRRTKTWRIYDLTLR